jgi:hypothetical protein
VPLTLQEGLPAQRWSVVGMRAYSANIIAARLIFYGQTNRPGVLGSQNFSDMHHPMFRLGQLGVFGTFDLNSIPQVEVLATAADTAETILLDLVPGS